ncbi:hypothetical protein KI387_008993, partial [Taxus chinensis]
MCMGCSTVIFSNNFGVGNCSYFSASWKQFFALRDHVTMGVLQTIGPYMENEVFCIKGSCHLVGSTDNRTAWQLSLPGINMLVTVGWGSWRNWGWN